MKLLKGQFAPKSETHFSFGLRHELSIQIVLVRVPQISAEDISAFSQKSRNQIVFVLRIPRANKTHLEQSMAMAFSRNH